MSGSRRPLRRRGSSEGPGLLPAAPALCPPPPPVASSSFSSSFSSPLSFSSYPHPSSPPSPPFPLLLRLRPAADPPTCRRFGPPASPAGDGGGLPGSPPPIRRAGPAPTGAKIGGTCGRGRCAYFVMWLLCHSKAEPPSGPAVGSPPPGNRPPDRRTSPPSSYAPRRRVRRSRRKSWPANREF